MKGGRENDEIRVAVRVRPPLDFEINKGHTFNHMTVDQKNKLIK